jgi:prepilin peptidase CpaA
MAILLFIPFCLLLVYAAISDIRGYIIPNWISITLIIIFFPTYFLAGLPVDQFWSFVWPALIVFAVCFGLFALGSIGGGDAKLLPASALWIGKAHMIEFIGIIAVAGGILCIVMMLFWSVKRYVPQLLGVVQTASMERPKVAPYGVAIAAGGLITFPFTPIYQAIQAL